jgi:hypothetical protein
MIVKFDAGLATFPFRVAPALSSQAAPFHDLGIGRPLPTCPRSAEGAADRGQQRRAQRHRARQSNSPTPRHSALPLLVKPMCQAKYVLSTNSGCGDWVVSIDTVNG